jgi:hypothetical protein
MGGSNNVASTLFLYAAAYKQLRQHSAEAALRLIKAGQHNPPPTLFQTHICVAKTSIRPAASHFCVENASLRRF